MTCPSSPSLGLWADSRLTSLVLLPKRTSLGMRVGGTQCPRSQVQAGLSPALAGLPPAPGEVYSDTGYLLSEYP